MRHSFNALILALLLPGLFYTQMAWPQLDHKDDKPLIAERINAQNFTRAIRGSSAIAGINDWMLSNGTLCASVSDPEHETYLSYRGGTLVDLGFCGRNDDQWNTYHEMFNLSREKILPASHIDTEITDTSTSLIVKGKNAGVENETRYRMDLDHPNELFIETRLTRIEKSDALYLFGALILHPHRSLTPFVLSTTDPAFSKGFVHPFANTHDKSGMMKVMFPADLHVLVGAEHIKPEISYGIESQSIELITKTGEHKPLRQFAINDQEFTLIGNFTNTLWFDTNGQPGLLQFMQTPLMDIGVGESLVTEKRILVSKRADVASITDQLYHGNHLRGKIENPDDRILVTDQEDHPLTFIKPESDGSFDAVLPKNNTRVKLVINEPWHDHVKTINCDLTREDFININTPSTFATLSMPKNKIMNLVFKGKDGTSDPVFFPDNSGFTVGKKHFSTDISSNRISLAGISADLKEVSIPAGNYTVYATRGPEFSLSKTTLQVKPNERAELKIDEPHRELTMPGWLSADFHVHSEFSFDSTLPAQRRVIDFVAQGGNVMVSTEHKRTINYQPIVEQLGLQRNIIAIAGVELTGMAHTNKIPRTMGHSNVFPVIAEEQQFMGGTLPHENRRLGEVIEEYKQKYPDVVFQLNHPRIIERKDETNKDDADDDINFFSHLSIGKKYDPSLPLDNKQNASLIEKLAGSGYRDIDFDAIELLNGQDMSTYELVRQDWFSLLLQGYRKTATADSDSHSAGEVVAMPRNYIPVHDNRIGYFDSKDIAQAVLRGELFGTTGPLLDVHLHDSHLQDKHMGELYSGKQSMLSIAIRTASWIPVEKISIYINGKKYKERSINKSGVYEEAITVGKDSFVTVEVEGKAQSDYAAVYPGFKPFAFSNPIFIDADGNGTWDAGNK